MKKLSLMLIPFALVAIAAPAFADLVTNGGFETGDFTGWSVNNLGGGTVCTAVGNGGNNNTPCSPKYTLAPHTGTWEAGIGDIPTSISQSIATTAGQQYLVSLWLANSPDATKGGGFVPMFISWGGTQIFSDNNFLPQGYGHLTFNVTGLAGSTTLEIGTAAGQNPPAYGALLIDDVNVPDGGSTLALLGLAVAGFAGVRRKLSL